MTEYRLYPKDPVPYVSTAHFHADRERAPHLEQPVHRPRLLKAYEYVYAAAQTLMVGWRAGPIDVTDLGCGDGGLLQLLNDGKNIRAWGYDFQPSNQQGWDERGVTAVQADVFGADQHKIRLGEIVVMTEVLEHLADPHKAVHWVAAHGCWLVASSPHTETDLSHDACHAWAWDMPGYKSMIEKSGQYTVLRHESVGMFQVLLARPRHT